MRISLALELLRRFPQEASLELCGDRGIEDLRVLAPIDGNIECETWDYFKLDDPKLPWLRDDKASNS